MTFIEAIQAAKKGKSVSRDSWSSGVWLRVRKKDGVVRMRVGPTVTVNYIATAPDVLAKDWGIGDSGARREGWT